MASSRNPRLPTRPRALIIAYDFPPHAAIGTMRTLRLVRELDSAGWRITVITGSPHTYLPGTPIDATLEEQVPTGVRVLRVRAYRPIAMLQRLVSGIRPGSRRRNRTSRSALPGSDARAVPKHRGSLGTLAHLRDIVDTAAEIPDKESGWITPAVVRGIFDALTHGRPDVIYSTAPPWSGQVIALALARISGIPWMADFRDPWARAPWRDWRRPFRQRAAAVLERSVIQRADRVAFVTRANLAEFTAFYGTTAAERLQLIPNGCDPSEFDGCVSPVTRDAFVLLHAGALYGARTPVPLLRAVSAAAGRGDIARRGFRVRFLGHVSPEIDLEGECRRLGILDLVEIIPRVTRAESLREMKAASALLLIQTGTTVSVPGKTYEYLAAGRPILALTEDGETADLVRASGIGVVVRPHDSTAIMESALLEAIALASREVIPPPQELYNGWTHARTAAHALWQLARPDQTAMQVHPGVAEPQGGYREDSVQ